MAAKRFAQRHDLLRGFPGDRQAGTDVDKAPFLDCLRGERERKSLEIPGHRLKPPLGLRVEKPERPGVDKGGVKMVGDVKNAVEKELLSELPEKGETFRNQPQSRSLLPGEPGAIDRKRTIRVGQGEPVDEEHPEDGPLGVRSDRLDGTERADLDPYLHEEAVAGLSPRVQADTLLLRVRAREREDGIVVSPERKPRKDAGVLDPFPDLLRPEPAEKPVFRVEARQLEEELLFEGRNAFSLPPVLQQRKRQEPAKGGKTRCPVPAHGVRSVPQEGKSRLTRAEQKEYLIFFPGKRVGTEEGVLRNETHLPAA